MKYLFLFLFFIFQTVLAAVDTKTDATYAPGLSSTKNYIKNPDCEKNTLNITSSAGLVTQNTSSPLNTQTGTQCRWNPASAATLKFDMYPMSVHNAAQQCIASFYTDVTTSGQVQAWLEYDGVKQTSTVTPVNAAYKGQKFFINYPCSLPGGTTTRKFVLETLTSPTNLPYIAGVHFEESWANGGVYLVTPPTYQKFTTAGACTYTPPANVLYIKVKMIGGGGGGSGSSTTVANGGAGGAGSATTFSTFLTANGGGGGTTYVGPAAGGTATISAPAYGVAVQGGTGSTGNYNGANAQPVFGGPMGAGTPYGGGGNGGAPNGAGANAVTYGAGGGGAGAPNPNAGGSVTGSGGSAGGFIEAIVPGPLAASYSCNVGAAGSAGSAGTSGFAGGWGGTGIIEVTEYYQ